MVGSLEQVLKTLVFFGQFNIAALVGNHAWIGDERADFVETGIKALKALQ